jgi:predicted ATPase
MHVSEPLMLEPTEIALPSQRGQGALSTLISSRGRGAAAHLARVALGDRARYEAIQKGMRDITQGRVTEVVVGEDTGQGYPLSFRLHDGKVIPASDLSQGLLVYFAFLTVVHREDAPSVLLIEEPENGVHPLRLREIVGLLRSLEKQSVQIVMTTHSPDLLNVCKPEEVLVFRRPTPDAGTEIRRLPADFERRAMGSKVGELWASEGEEGLLDMLPPVEPSIHAEAE